MMNPADIAAASVLLTTGSLTLAAMCQTRPAAWPAIIITDAWATAMFWPLVLMCDGPRWGY